MTILQEIFTWSEANLLPWQKDAVGRLYVSRELTSTDLQQLHELALSEHGIPSPNGLSPKPLDASQFAAPPVPNRLVQLTAIRDLENINALVTGVSLPLVPTGITVIYGGNGAGKSGYSRVLKRACRARDQKEPILPDARKTPTPIGPARATFDVVIDGKPDALLWSSDMKESPEQLSEIAIFDTRCARAYVDNTGDFAYVPYGLDILEGLVKACNGVRDKITSEKILHAPNPDVYASLAQEPTTVGKALVGISTGATKAEDIGALAKLVPEQEERLVVLKRVLNEPDAKQKASAIRQRVRWFLELKGRVEAAALAVSAPRVASLQKLVDEARTTKAAAELAANKFQSTPGLLPGTGGDAWKALFYAARDFAVESHAGHAFPDLPPESQCPLCQNQLGSPGNVRLKSFGDFLQQKTETAATAARKLAGDSFKDFKSAVPSIQIEEALKLDVSAADTQLPETIANYLSVLQARHGQVLEACAEKVSWADVAETPSSTPAARLQELANQLEAEAKALDATMDEKSKVALLDEHTELDAKRRLAEMSSAVLEVVRRYSHCAKLQACLNTLSGPELSKISRKATQLSNTMAKQDVADALNAELTKLKIQDLHVVVRSDSPGGKTQFKLALEWPGSRQPADVLSEGEQRALAIAAFLAEVTLGKGLGGIVFDDPVSSLDHERQWNVAARLIEEAKCRQVVVFTHHIYFMFWLNRAATNLKVPIAMQYVRQTSRGFGDYSPELPFKTLSTAKRIKQLREDLLAVRKAHKLGDTDAKTSLTQDIYDRLRDTWERAVEDVLLNGTVERFDAGVFTQKLRLVAVEDTDHQVVEAGMTKCSDFAHDASKTIQLPTPHPDEVEKDIEALDAWQKAVVQRREVTKARRG